MTKKKRPTREATLLLLESINPQFLTPDEKKKVEEKIQEASEKSTHLFKKLVA